MPVYVSVFLGPVEWLSPLNQTLRSQEQGNWSHTDVRV